ncbi:MAG: 1-hydroxycarotenoid 3,4-desaturase CrtD [Bacteroidota bacterium]
MKAIIIGAGISGIAASIRLKCKGYDVEVYEANDYPGGKLTAFSIDDYRFDAGPSLFTLPYLVDDLFRTAGKEPRDYFKYQRLDVSCHYFFEDGTRLQAYTDKQRLADEVSKKVGVEGDVVNKYLEKSRFIYEKAGKIFLEKSLHKLGTWLTKDVAKALLHINKYGLFRSMNDSNESFLQHPKLVQLFNRYATYNGSNPYEAPGILTSIPHLEFNEGTYFPEGGMHEITMSLFRLAEDIGVVFKFNQKVDKIEVENGKAVGISIGDQIERGEIVVSNMDIVPTYRHLLAGQKAPEKTMKQERSSSALIFYWGIKKAFSELDLHNIFFTKNYQEEFEHIFKKKALYHDPTVYINITSKYKADDAPSGGENWFVMINMPPDTGQDWPKVIAEAKQNILRKVSQALKTDIAPLVEAEEILTPRMIEEKTSSFGGSLYGASSNSRYAAFLRHPNFSQKIKGLYFCGGSVHPGGGIPLCLLSAKILADLVD